jgi:hypothetical protein
MSTTVINTLRLGALALIAVPTLAIAQPPPPPPLPGTAPPPPGGGGYAPIVGPDRSGMTFELSLGFGITQVSPDEGEGDSFNGLSGLNLGVGGWISPNTAITVRIAGTSFTQDFSELGGPEVQFIAGMLGVTAQQMVSDTAWVGGGLGIGILTDDQDETEGESGLALDLRAGYNFYQSAKNAFNASIEITPGFFDGGRVTGIGLQVGWQAL